MPYDFTHMWNLINKLNEQEKWGQTHRWRQLWGELEGGGIEQKCKRTCGCGQQCCDCWGKGDIRGINGDGKNAIKIKFLKWIKSLNVQPETTKPL